MEVAGAGEHRRAWHWQWHCNCTESTASAVGAVRAGDDKKQSFQFRPTVEGSWLAMIRAFVAMQVAEMKGWRFYAPPPEQ